MFKISSKIKKKISQQSPSHLALKLKDCLAKTYCDDEGKTVPGRDVFTHCLIVGKVAHSMLSRLPCWLRKDLFPPGSELIAAAHDIGKVCPTFQEKIRRGKKKGSSNYIPNSLPGLETADPELEKTWGYHAGVSEISAKASRLGKYIPEILGQHHGYSPEVGGSLATDQKFGGKAWQERREELLSMLKKTLKCEWPNVETALHARVIAGLTTVSDWIGSGPVFEDPKNKEWLEGIEKALDEAGFSSPDFYKGLSFEEIFNFAPLLVQQKLIDACQERGVYILEAPMGIGKTEAALYVSYKLLTAGKATGIYFALPTQLTSDKIYERINKFLEKILTPASLHKKTRLIHSNAWLKTTTMGEEGQPGGSWFQSAKRSILAPFGVGTIDQALMAVMNVKHGSVRTLGLAGKIVILDEVHSYDSYTGTILDILVETLQKLKCTVIILSATLTLDRRKALLKKTPTHTQYPSISSLISNVLHEIPVEQQIPDAHVKIQLCQDESACIEEALLRAEEGQQVLWIENTVADAQMLYKRLAAMTGEIGIACGLLHSRFLKCDRQLIEDKWVSHFGKEGIAYRQDQGRILIGTQVLEQSLDIDADFLISRMSPTDMLLQRLGRLWRHSGTSRPPGAKHEAWILTPSLKSALEKPKKAFDKSANVYAPYVLLRSLEVWSKIEKVSIPGQIRSLIEQTYEQREEKNVWKSLRQELENRKEKLKGLALIGVSAGIKTLPENKASTRYSEQDTVDVLLIQDIKHEKDGCRVRFLNGKEEFLPKKTHSINRNRQQMLSVFLMQNTVRVPAYAAPESISLSQLDWLNNFLYIGNEEEGALRVAKVHPSEKLTALDGTGSAHSSKFLSYNSTLGYQEESNNN